VSGAEDVNDGLKLLSPRLTSPVGVGRVRGYKGRSRCGNRPWRRGDGVAHVLLYGLMNILRVPGQRALP
jgi:hypothetical protein